MRYLVTLMLLCFVNGINAQCSITRYDYDTANYMFSADAEQLYINEDLENGTRAIVGGFFFVVNKSDKYQAKIFVEIRYGHSGSKPTIVPRQIKFSLANGEIITSIAESYERKYKGEIVREDCLFRINKEQMVKIVDNSLSSFTIIDTRGNETFTMQPYKGLFQEQIDCLMKRVYE